MSFVKGVANPEVEKYSGDHYIRW